MPGVCTRDVRHRITSGHAVVPATAVHVQVDEAGQHPGQASGLGLRLGHGRSLDGHHLRALQSQAAQHKALGREDTAFQGLQENPSAAGFTRLPRASKRCSPSEATRKRTSCPGVGTPAPRHSVRRGCVLPASTPCT